MMEKLLQRFVQEIQEIHKLLKEINDKLDKQPAILVTPEAAPRSFKSSGSYIKKEISDAQLWKLNGLLKDKPTEILENILVKYNVDNLKQLNSSQASETIKKLMGQ